MRRLAVAVALGLLAAAAGAQETAPRRTILAIGAHAGDMELTAGALLLHQARRGDRTVLLHLTLGERGNPRLSPADYGRQKKEEAEAVAEALGAEVAFGPWADGELPDDEASRRWVAAEIRRVRPTLVITHWRESLHRDHATTHRIVKDAVLLAALQGTAVEGEPWRGVRSVWYAENWEDREEFEPFVFVDVTDAIDAWREAVAKYEFARGEISGFPYVEYYAALAVVRGAEAYRKRAVAFAVEQYARRRVLDAVP
ncbi:MAG: PIG-L deacetylase family protein [Thermoanaerobaculia bacterium]